ncbi:MAG: C25 family cysteine peptidase, partial [Candidatus Promineifilaceae bacterium]|nr:C25 family cysteine peptidase [Candidatus Promineifilaceae bacterium]
GRLEIPLTGVQPTGGPGQLTIRVWSSNQSPADPDHHLQVWLNGYELANHFWDGIRQETLHLTLTDGVLKPATNLLVLSVPGDTGAAGESIFLDWIRLKYEGRLNMERGQLMFRSDAANLRVSGAEDEALIFDVSDPLAPVLLINTEIEDGVLRLSGTEDDAESVYLALNPRQAIRPRIEPAPKWDAPLREAERGADYVAIVPPAAGFDDALQPLLDHRRAQGLRTSTVPLRQVYDEFAHGREKPEAIRAFLAHAASEWNPAPRFVLLVGDASYDVNDYTAGPNRNLLPTYLVFTEFTGYVASDSWFTTFDSTPVPSVAIGRLPAQSGEQLEVMVQKTIDYESARDTGWRSRALLVADDELRFNATSEWLAERLYDTGYQTQKLYMTENEDIRDAVISAVNHGVSIVNYVGHGGIDVWGDEMVLEARDARMMMNGSRLPIFTTFTCLNGYFNHPSMDALAETLLWTANGGIVAAVAPSGRTFTSQQTPLANLFYQSLLNQEVKTLGEALKQAKATSAGNANLGEVLHAFNLLGDPALRFQMPANRDE